MTFQKLLSQLNFPLIPLPRQETDIPSQVASTCALMAVQSPRQTSLIHLSNAFLGVPGPQLRPAGAITNRGAGRSQGTICHLDLRWVTWQRGLPHTAHSSPRAAPSRHTLRTHSRTPPGLYMPLCKLEKGGPCLGWTAPATMHPCAVHSLKDRGAGRCSTGKTTTSFFVKVTDIGILTRKEAHPITLTIRTQEDSQAASRGASRVHTHWPGKRPAAGAGPAGRLVPEGRQQQRYHGNRRAPRRPASCFQTVSEVPVPAPSSRT